MSSMTAVSVDERDYQALASGRSPAGAAPFRRPATDGPRPPGLSATADDERYRPPEAGPGNSYVAQPSPVARIDAVFSVLCRQDDLLLLASEGQAETLRQRLQGQIFFMDKLTITDVSAELRRMRCSDPPRAICWRLQDCPGPLG